MRTSNRSSLMALVWTTTSLLLLISTTIALTEAFCSSLSLSVSTSTRSRRPTTFHQSTTERPQQQEEQQQQQAVDDMGSTVIHKENYDIVTVDLADDRDYPIYIGTDYSEAEASQLLQKHVNGNTVLIVTNDNIDKWYLQKYTQLFEINSKLNVHTLVLPDGEEYKNMDVLNTILDKCLELRLDRKSTLVALGGGVVGDMVGFAAAIYVRGIDFIQIPTTVMAMVDSSVGGKTGVNHKLGKNMIGSFHQPNCVFVDTQTLSTLPDRELASGVAEIIKYGLIRDADFFQWQEANLEQLIQRQPDSLRVAITRSCQNKAAVVKADEKEAGLRATLNLGHTFGHAIENGSGYGTYLHGEAVAIGTAMAAEMSYKMEWISEETLSRIYGALQLAKLPTKLPNDSPMNRQTFLDLMSVDKKVANGQLRLILLKGDLGECVFTGEFDEQALLETIDEFVADCRGNSS